MKFGFIGTGNMGGALVKAVVAAGADNEIYIADKDTAKAEALAAEVNATVVSNEVLASECDFIVVGVKPQACAAMFNEITSILEQREDKFTLISMVAGMQIEKIQQLAGGCYPVIRIMPNTPAAVGEGMILYSVSKETNEDTVNGFLAAFEKAGRLDELQENLIDAASAVSGCGPAYAYIFAEALADGAVRCGLPRDKAMMYAAQMLLGSAKMLLESGEHPGKLKDAVCSPGGSTIVGVSALEDGGFRAAAINAVYDSYIKTVDLGK